jgi:hypothetical protein
MKASLIARAAVLAAFAAYSPPAGAAVTVSIEPANLPVDAAGLRLRCPSNGLQPPETRAERPGFRIGARG